MNKKKLRNWAKEERKKLNIKILSDILLQKVQECNEYKNAKNIMIFYPLEFEINLLPLLQDKTKNFYLPRIKNEDLECCPFNLNDELCESCFKTKEPKTFPINKDLIDLVIVPALAVDKNNFRLGYGGGFYDRFLEQATCKKICCISKTLIIDSVFPKPHDIRIDKIIST